MTNRQISDMTLETLKEFVIEVVNDKLYRRQQAQKDRRTREEAEFCNGSHSLDTATRFTHNIGNAAGGSRSLMSAYVIDTSVVNLMRHLVNRNVETAHFILE